LAGARGVALYEGLRRAGILREEPDAPALTRKGRAFLAEWNIDADALAHGRRPLCRRCLDWSERRTHLGGALGAALLSHFLAERWMKRGPGRTVTLTAAGEKALRGLIPDQDLAP